MSDELRIGKFERVRVQQDGPDVRLTVPKNPCQCHWTDMAQLVGALNVGIQQAQQWEKDHPDPGRLFI